MTGFLAKRVVRHGLRVVRHGLRVSGMARGWSGVPHHHIRHRWGLRCVLHGAGSGYPTMPALLAWRGGYTHTPDPGPETDPGAGKPFVGNEGVHPPLGGSRNGVKTTFSGFSNPSSGPKSLAKSPF